MAVVPDVRHEQMGRREGVAIPARHVFNDHRLSGVYRLSHTPFSNSVFGYQKDVLRARPTAALLLRPGEDNYGAGAKIISWIKQAGESDEIYAAASFALPDK